MGKFQSVRLDALKPTYIETPLTKYVGGEDKLVWPYIFVFLTIGGVIGLLCI